MSKYKGPRVTTGWLVKYLSPNSDYWWTQGRFDTKRRAVLNADSLRMYTSAYKELKIVRLFRRVRGL